MDRCWPPRSLHSPPPRRRARCHAARPRTTPTTGSSTAAAAYFPFLRRHPPSLASWHRTDRERADEACRQDREQDPVRGYVATPAGLAHAVDHATALERGEPPPPPARRGLSRGRRQNPQRQRAGQSIGHSTHGTGHPACASAATLHRPQDEPRKVE